MASSSSKQPADQPIGRRGILRVLLGFSFVSTLAGVITPIIGYLLPPESVSASGGGRVLVGTTKDIPVGQGKVVPVAGKPVMVTNTSQGVHAFSAICTHLGCVCEFDPNRQMIVCPCHDGLFNPASGTVVSGPPPSPLAVLPVSVDGEDIYVGEA